MRVFKIILSIILLVAFVITIWSEYELRSVEATKHFDGQSGIGVMIMVGSQLVSMVISILILVITIIIVIVKNKIESMDYQNIIFALTCIGLSALLLKL
ncbi:MAG: hypothetical protein QY309_10120 [Cyclobacteriaceae bacterium]|nr:MAG: hypothetical protein QY309_10120 [Cyclobacteriaceae bacterium]